MFNFKKYALAAALVIPATLGFTANDSDAAKLSIDKDLANAVNVRSEAKMGDNILGLISDKEKEYEIKEDQGDWIKIDFDGKDGYVAGRFFHVLGEDKVLTATNFRKGDSVDSEVFDVLKEGSTVKVLAIANNGYVKVEADGKEGYVYNNLLESFRKANQEKFASQSQANTTTSKKANTQSQASQNTQTYEVVEYTQQASPQENNNQQSYQGSSNWAKEWIAQRESNGSYTAYNPNGGYYGRYQLNPSLVSYGASPAEQERAADNYVYQRYGSWEAAQSFWAANGWY